MDIVGNYIVALLAECLPTDNLHGPDQSILVREFLNAIAIISFHLYRLRKVSVLTFTSPLPTTHPSLVEIWVQLQRNYRLVYKSHRRWKMSSRRIFYKEQDKYKVWHSRMGLFQIGQDVSILSVGNIFSDPQKYLHAYRYREPCFRVYSMFCAKNTVSRHLGRRLSSIFIHLNIETAS